MSASPTLPTVDFDAAKGDPEDGSFHNTLRTIAGDRARFRGKPVKADKKGFNGVFRAWLSCHQPVGRPIIWGHCIVHLSHPNFSGNVLHTSGVVAITKVAGFSLVETRNSFYALLGPELVMPAGCTTGPMDYVAQQRERSVDLDARISAAMTADPECGKCFGTGVYNRDDRSLALCDRCCRHNQGWWQLEGAYGSDNGRWACKAGCGIVVAEPPLDLEFLPRASSS